MTIKTTKNQTLYSGSCGSFIREKTRHNFEIRKTKNIKNSAISMTLAVLAKTFYYFSVTEIFCLVHGDILVRKWRKIELFNNKFHNILAVEIELEISEKHYGKGHPQTVTTLMSLGHAWGSLGALEKQKDWNGIVGFFHPFWYVEFLFGGFAYWPWLAMPEVVESECYGQQFEQPKTDGRGPNVLYTRAIMMLPRIRSYSESR